jgi:hypothetical protein
MTTTTMQGHKDNNNNKALQTEKTTSADAVDLTVNLYSWTEMAEGETI